jgi:hypothetical protein
MSVQEDKFENSVKALIELGSNIMVHSAVLGRKDEVTGKLMNRELWESKVNNLSETQLQSIIKGFVLLDRMIENPNLGYGLFGSVSPTAYLCTRYAQRFPDKEAQITEWVVNHRINEYDPFGTTVLNECLSFASHEQAMMKRKKDRN